MSRETVVCTASKPRVAQRLGDLRLRREPAPRRGGGSRPAGRTCCSRQHLLEDREPMVELVGGDGQRRRQPQDALARGADEQPALQALGDDVRRRRGRARAPSSSPRPRTSTTPAAARAVAQLGALRRTPASSSSSTVVARPRTPPRTRRGSRRTCSRGRPARMPPARSSATSRQPIGRPFARPLASVTTSGLTPSCSQAKKLPVRPTPVCTSSKTSSAPRSSASVARGARNSGRAG